MYKISKTGLEIIRLSDGAFIPVDANNSAYKAYLEWEAKGGIISPWKTQSEIDADAKRINNDMIKARMIEADLKVIRAIVEGDKARIDDYKREQDELRKQLNE